MPFVGLAEGLVLAACRQARVPLQRIRPTLQRLQQDLGEHALDSQRLDTDGAVAAAGGGNVWRRRRGWLLPAPPGKSPDREQNHVRRSIADRSTLPTPYWGTGTLTPPVSLVLHEREEIKAQVLQTDEGERDPFATMVKTAVTAKAPNMSAYGL